ncbi:MAG TPA: hypothetical protein VLF66_16070 [Thermoanaerobaculia bacterium]|nr:hypothetical protein [Thermoanaerobaculia bacterium]
MSEPMSPPPPPATPPPSAPPPPAGPDPRQQVQGPAIGLIITAVVGGLWAIFSLLGNVLGLGMMSLDQYTGGSQWAEYALGGGFGIVSAVIGLAIAGFILWVALQMKELKGWTVSVVASILAMIPCISPCCIIGLPIGIWALVVLLKPEVKAAFTS